MNKPASPQQGEQRGYDSPPSNKASRQGLLLPVFVGATTAVSILSVGFGVWTLNQSKPDLQTAHQSAVIAQKPDESGPKRTATLNFWGAMIQADNKTMPAIKAAIEAYKPNETPDIALPKLCHLADVTSSECDKWSAEIKSLNVLHVDELLLNHFREELRINNQGVAAFNGIAETSVAFYHWQKKKSAPSENILGDMMDSFFQGMMGRPFAGYEKFKADAAKLDAEGQLLVERYLAYCKSLTSTIEESSEHNIKEHQLRSELSGKYQVEFAPRPE